MHARVWNPLFAVGFSCDKNKSAAYCSESRGRLMAGMHKQPMGDRRGAARVFRQPASLF